MEFKDYYQTLGLAKTASAKEIKQAYRKLARKHHPDVNPGDKAAEAKFKEINEAYEVLGDPEKRKKYDELGANWRQYEQAQQAGQSPFGDVRWTSGGAGPGGFRAVDEEELREHVRRRQPVLRVLPGLLRRRADDRAPGPRRPRRARPRRPGRRGRD